ncbi:hypothetical protein [Paenibacillus sp. MMO-58]|uniref:hypothetical protein n=1 Tax=Paenibacillus sp. MMO-58 TaxID=3081290 RepID=UPI003019837F
MKTPEITNHFKERWMTRVRGLNFASRKDIDQINTELTIEIANAFEQSQLIVQDALTDTVTSKTNYYLYQDIIMVTDVNIKRLITCYRISLPFPEPIVSNIIETTMSKIDELRRMIHDRHTELIPKWQLTNSIVTEKEQEIEELQSNIDRIKDELAAIRKEDRESRAESDRMYDEIKEYARILCNSMALKQDIIDGIC